MSWIRLAIRLVLVVAAIGAAMVWKSANSASAAKAAPAKAAAAKATGASAEAKVKRGEYLVTVIGCNDCHTPGSLYGSPDFTRRLSGSELGWAGPWGVAYAANLTPDLETGLGYWSDKQIVDAMRTGTDWEGRPLAPIMPWSWLSALTDDDAYAIAAYLRSLPAVSHAVPKPVPPGQKVEGPVVSFPPPSAWDAPRASPADAAKH